MPVTYSSSLIIVIVQHGSFVWVLPLPFFFLFLLKLQKIGIHAACHILNPISRNRNRIFVGALFRWPAVGSHPDRPSYIFFPSQPFHNTEQSVVRGFEIQGKLDLRKPAVFSPWAVSCSKGQWSSVFPQNTMALIPPLVPRWHFSSAPEGWLSLLRARMGLICRF